MGRSHRRARSLDDPSAYRAGIRLVRNHTRGALKLGHVARQTAGTHPPPCRPAATHAFQWRSTIAANR